MAYSDITQASVLSAIREFDHIGKDAFLDKYGFADARKFFIRHDGKDYASKAIVGAAHGFAFPDQGPLTNDAFSGGQETVVSVLERLGFELVGHSSKAKEEGGLSLAQHEHYQVAQSFPGEFTATEFRDKYLAMFPERNPTSILPSDFSYNNAQVAKEKYPSFLLTTGNAAYKFVGLDAVPKKMARNPDWTRDEIILALEFYLFLKDAMIPAKNSSEIQTLANEIRSVAEALGLSGDEKFRNNNGVYMKIMNIRSHDPAYTSQGKVGLSSSNKLEEEVWGRFGNDLDGLKAAATLIREQLALGSGEFAATEYDEPEIEEAAEGRLVTRLHRTRERSRRLVADKKRQFEKVYGRLFCEACGFDFAEVYGERGEGFIECHHTKPVHEMKSGEKTKLADLALVCANCHRMIHAKRPWLSMEQIKLFLGGDAAPFSDRAGKF